MSDWGEVLLISVVFIAAVVLAVVLFSLWQEQKPKQERGSEEPRVVKQGPVESPVVTPRIVLRKRPVLEGKFKRRQVAETTFRRKKILGNGNTQTATPTAMHRTPSIPEPITMPAASPITINWFKTAEPQARIKTREIKIDLDEIHRVTGIPIRDCPCEECQEIRAHVGS